MHEENSQGQFVSHCIINIIKNNIKVSTMRTTKATVVEQQSLKVTNMEKQSLSISNKPIKRKLETLDDIEFELERIMFEEFQTGLPSDIPMADF